VGFHVPKDTMWPSYILPPCSSVSLTLWYRDSGPWSPVSLLVRRLQLRSMTSRRTQRPEACACTKYPPQRTCRG
jgi:hypothetical protein